MDQTYEDSEHQTFIFELRIKINARILLLFRGLSGITQVKSFLYMAWHLEGMQALCKDVVMRKTVWVQGRAVLSWKECSATEPQAGGEGCGEGGSGGGGLHSSQPLPCQQDLAHHTQPGQQAWKE